MRIGGKFFSPTTRMSPTELARALEEPRLPIRLWVRNLPHSVDAQVAVPQRRRSAEEVLATL